MFKFFENPYVSLLEQERKNKMELEKAKKNNEELKEKVKKLESEHNDLKEKFNKNELDIITRKNNLNNLLEMLQRERRAALEESQRLQICKEQLDSINKFIDELKPIKEQLNFKQNVTECLHDLLVKTKLRIAESDDVLQGLHDYLSQLEYDVEKTKEIHSRGLGHWQEEFLAARLREADVILEFDKLKREIAMIKSELEEKTLIRGAIEQTLSENHWPKNVSNENEKDFEQILQQEEISIANAAELQNEVDSLRHQLRRLEDQKEDCQKKIKSNEEMKVHLNEVRRSIWLREFETNQKTENLREKYKTLADKMVQELEKIQNSIEEKDMAIARIQEKINDLQKLNDTLEHDLKTSSLENATSELEEKKTDLEKEIVRLKES